MAATLADQDGSRLDIVNKFDVPGEGAMLAGWIPMPPDNLVDYTEGCRAESDRRLSDTVSDSRSRTGLSIFGTDKVQTHLIRGRARTDIPELADRLGTDLIVMGSARLLRRQYRGDDSEPDGSMSPVTAGYRCAFTSELSPVGSGAFPFLMSPATLRPSAHRDFRFPETKFRPRGRIRCAYRWSDSNRHVPGTRDFESRVSTNSTTPARGDGS